MLRNVTPPNIVNPKPCDATMKGAVNKLKQQFYFLFLG